MIKRFLALITTAVLCTMLLFPAFDIEAAGTEKTVIVKLTSEYESCTFDITTENTGKCDVRIQKPDNGVNADKVPIVASKVKDGNYKAIIEDAKPGKYKVLVHSKNAKNVGKVKVKVTAAAAAEKDIVDDIKVGKSINGLTWHMRDDTLVVEWDDESVGSVNISVTDLATSQVISNEAVSEQSYECPIPEKTEKVLLSVVPSSSAAVDGASIDRKVNVVNQPKGEVKFAEGDFTNEDYISADVTLEKPYGIIALANDIEMVKEESLEPGTYNVTIPLDDEGDNEVLVYIVGPKGNMRSTQKTIFRDIQPPVLSFDQEYDGATMASGVNVISGTAEDFSSLKVNDKDLHTTTDGHFDYECEITDGPNSFVFTASDEAGNDISTSFTITGVKSRPTGGLLRGLMPLAGIVLFVFFASKLGKKKTRKRKIKRTQGLDASGSNADTLRRKKKKRKVKRPDSNESGTEDDGQSEEIKTPKKKVKRPRQEGARKPEGEAIKQPKSPLRRKKKGKTIFKDRQL